ncbi:hypothetical protein DY931_21380 [Pseudomonas aeruginosa]|uniref:hypothetical protein n=1 Tax=Pseudomonas aeruginosa TaxID=287 RepID=UPI000F830464|nr:hypothetical protein [Pseudomonas aeruginosa]RTR58811.1 hypothetical protein DY931_21380 [Pseudomonas aeruginosa]
MQVCKPLGVVLSTLLLAGCANLASKYASSPPTEAITAIAKEYDPRAHGAEIGVYNSVYVDSSSLHKTMQMAHSYCMKTGGRPEAWPNNSSAFNCVDRANSAIHFAVKVDNASELRILERTKDNNDIFDTLLLGMGHKTQQQVLEDRQRALQRAQREREEAQQRLKELRIRNRDHVAYVGARVCQFQRSDTLGSSNVVFVATVEQVAGDRLKVFVERAFFEGAPDLAPGGFRQQYAWVNIWDVDSCRL